MLTIPKQVHLFMPCSEDVAGWRRWEASRPGWRVRCWTYQVGLPLSAVADEDGTLVECRCPGFLEECANLGARLCVHRLEVLEQLGGVCPGPEGRLVARVPPLAEAAAEVGGRAGRETTEVVRLTGGLLAAAPHHPWVREVLRLLPDRTPATCRTVINLASEVAALYPEVALLDPTKI